MKRSLLKLVCLRPGFWSLLAATVKDLHEELIHSPSEMTGHDRSEQLGQSETQHFICTLSVAQTSHFDFLFAAVQSVKLFSFSFFFVPAALQSTILKDLEFVECF